MIKFDPLELAREWQTRAEERNRELALYIPAQPHKLLTLTHKDRVFCRIVGDTIVYRRADGLPLLKSDDVVRL